MQKIEKLKAVMHYFQEVTNNSELVPNLFFTKTSAIICRISPDASSPDNSA